MKIFFLREAFSGKNKLIIMQWIVLSHLESFNHKSPIFHNNKKMPNIFDNVILSNISCEIGKKYVILQNHFSRLLFIIK